MLSGDTARAAAAAHRASAEARGYTVGYADLVEKWVLLNPYGDYRGAHATEDAAWTAAPIDRFAGAMARTQ